MNKTYFLLKIILFYLFIQIIYTYIINNIYYFDLYHKSNFVTQLFINNYKCNIAHFFLHGFSEELTETSGRSDFLILFDLLRLFDKTVLLIVECKNLLLIDSFFLTQPLGPITAALLAPFLASSSNASCASLK